MKNSCLVKKLLIAICLFPVLAYAQVPQTNVFPAVGKAGIGTLNPQEALHIKAGSIKIDDLALPGATRLLSVDALGRVVAGPCLSCPSSIVGGSGTGGGVPLEWWSTKGNANTNPNTHFIGTTDYTSFIIKVASQPRMSFYNNGATYIHGALNVADDITSQLLSVTGTATIGTGSNTSGVKLKVNGGINASAVKVLVNPMADYVFEKEYNLMNLSDLKTFIDANGHLPNIPSAEEVKANEGIEVGGFSVKLLEKIEELTLHVISQEEKIQAQEIQIKKLQEAIQQQGK